MDAELLGFNAELDKIAALKPLTVAKGILAAGVATAGLHALGTKIKRNNEISMPINPDEPTWKTPPR